MAEGSNYDYLFKVSHCGAGFGLISQHMAPSSRSFLLATQESGNRAFSSVLYRKKGLTWQLSRNCESCTQLALGGRLDRILSALAFHT